MKMFSRRAMLRGSALGAGATLLSPLLSRLVHADEVPRRFVFVVEGNCFEPVTCLSGPARAAINATTSSPIDGERWWYRDYAHNAVIDVPSADLQTARSLEPLRDLASRATVLFGLSSRVVGGGHSAKHGALSSSRTVGGAPGGQTIDSWLASQSELCGDAPFDALRLGVGTGRPLDFGTCAYARDQPAPMILDPATAYATLFGGAVMGPSRVQFMERGGLLDFAREDVNAALASFRGGSIERAKLEQYLASIEQLRGRHERMVELSSSLTPPTAPDMNPLYGTDDALDVFAAQMELATAALLGGLTNVCVIGSGTGGDFGLRYGSVSSVGRHDMHHGSGRSSELLEAVHTVTERQVAEIATLASTLAATPEVGGGSMLDHTLIVYVSDNGEQHHSTASEFPVLMLGGEAMGRAPGGRTLVYPGIESANHRQLSNLWNTVGHLGGFDLNDFGEEGPTRIAEGPLGELLV